MIKFREMFRSDLIHVRPMFEKMLDELSQDPKWISHGSPMAESGDQFALLMINTLKKNPRFKGFVAAHGTVTKGFLTVTLNDRPLCVPSTVLLGNLLYVDPVFRGRGVANKLIEMAWQWGLEKGAGAFETWYVPGTQQHAMFSKAGFKTFYATGVLLDKEGKPQVLEPPVLKTDKPKAEAG